MDRDGFDSRDKLARVRDLHAEKILDLSGGDQQGDAVGESDYDGSRDEADGGAKTGHSEKKQNDSSHHRHHQQAGKPEFRDDGRDDNDERAGGSGKNLDPPSSETRMPPRIAV